VEAIDSYHSNTPTDVPPKESSTAAGPPQITVSDAEISPATGTVVTSITTESMLVGPEHPKRDVAVTTTVVNESIPTRTELPVIENGDHVKVEGSCPPPPPPPVADALSVTESPEQINVAEVARLTLGFWPTLTLTVAMSEQPAEFVPVTVYVVLKNGDA
jgi:hypothetical protein